MGARGSAATKDVAGKMMGGKAGEETDQVADADDSHAQLQDSLADLHKGRGKEAVRAQSKPLFQLCRLAIIQEVREPNPWALKP